MRKRRSVKRQPQHLPQPSSSSPFNANRCHISPHVVAIVPFSFEKAIRRHAPIFPPDVVRRSQSLLSRSASLMKSATAWWSVRRRVSGSLSSITHSSTAGYL
uniref:Uncharacterized protein n=1 Tax=Cucumis melo TaxID=3656 RepID=A0A9I9D3C9_CUCME